MAVCMWVSGWNYDDIHIKNVEFSQRTIKHYFLRIYPPPPIFKKQFPIVDLKYLILDHQSEKYCLFRSIYILKRVSFSGVSGSITVYYEQ